MAEKRWNRCDVCGQFIAYAAFEDFAVRHLVEPHSEFGYETWETRCAKHAERTRVPATQPSPQPS